MRRFFEAYASPAFLPQAVAEMEGDQLTAPVEPPTGRTKPGKANFLEQLVAEIPWGHHMLILDKLTHPAARHYYLRGTVRRGWRLHS